VTEWLLLIHQLPPKPAYLRLKVARRLQRIGAVPLKNTVYVLPANAATVEDMQWTVRDIRENGGEANLCKAQFVDGLSDGELQRRFNDARDADYEPLLKEAKKRNADLPSIRQRMEPIRAIDFFGASKGQALEALVDRTRTAIKAAKLDLRGRTWVTRAGIHVDRMASAWLIKRFIDPEAKFQFVTGEAKPQKGQVRFDMFDADFTHEGDQCTFEVLARRAGITDLSVRLIGEIIHDIDLRDDKFKRPETAGIAMLVNGIALAHRDDHERLRRAMELFDEVRKSVVPLTANTRR
jgi:hypothetical protein